MERPVENGQISKNGTSTEGNNDLPRFNRFGQHEPAVVRIRNIITQYVGEVRGFGVDEIVKELVQNADDSSATELHFILDKRTLSEESVWPEWRPLQGPAFCIYNNKPFSQDDISAIQKLGVGSKGTNPDKTGQFGIGFNVVYQLTDCPILLSGNRDVCMFDPHMTYIPGANDERPGGHVDLIADPSFRETWEDFMDGFLPQFFSNEDATMFRLPLRHKDNVSSICKLGYGDKEIDQIQYHLQSTDFRMFMHDAILFTKNIEKISVSCIKKNGQMEDMCVVSRHINEQQKNELKSAFRRVSQEMRLFIEGKIPVEDIQRFSLFYDLVTRDEYSSFKWLVSQSFGFQKSLSATDLDFLKVYFKEGSKRFLPVGGIASRHENFSTFRGVVYSFLQLPIPTGLPVHVNGHFAIHSSRRTIWSSTAFGQWNSLLRECVLVPAYCNFLRELTNRLSPSNVSLLVSVLPEISKTKDVFFSDLVSGLYNHLVHGKFSVIPITLPDDGLVFSDISDVLFVSQKPNVEIENTLTKLGYKVCRYQDISWKLQNSGIKDVQVISPSVVITRLKMLASVMKLPEDVSQTPFESPARVALILKYCLGENASSSQYLALDGVPLCLTSDGTLRVFSISKPVFVTTRFPDLLPNNPDRILHKDLCNLFTIPPNTQVLLPVKNLLAVDLASFLEGDMPFMKTGEWASLFWSFIKTEVSLGLSEPSQLLLPFRPLPLLPSSRGEYVTLRDGKSLLNTAKVNSAIRAIIAKLDLPTVDFSLMSSAFATDQEIGLCIHSFVLDAMLPEDFLHSVSKNGVNRIDLTGEECELLLQYINMDVGVVKDEELRETLKKLPLFETVEDTYTNLPSDKHVAVLDNCIPTRGISTWMERSDCVLLKEKSSYKVLYEELGLSRENAIDVYFRNIFPNFDKFDDELRMAHLLSLRDTLIPLLPTFGTDELREQFWMQLSESALISFEGSFYPVCHFYKPDMTIIAVLGTHRSLPEVFTSDEWMSMLTSAGLKNNLTNEEILQCAVKLAESDDRENYDNDVKMLLEIATKSDLVDDEWKQLSDIKFIPQTPIEVDDDMVNICLPKVPLEDRICLRGSVLYENMKDRHLYRSSILAWSRVSSLPKWLSLPENKYDLLEIQERPQVEDVCLHCVTLCSAINEHLPDSAFTAFKKIMYYVFDYLKPACQCNKKGCRDCGGLRELSKATCRCIPLKGGKVLVASKQIVLKFPKDIDVDFLQPYVYQRPSDLGKYDDLLKRIGCHTKPTPDVYGEILYRLRQEIGNCPLQANQKLTASMAVYGLFTSLQQDSAPTFTMRPLYLPSDKAILCLAQELVANDNELIAKVVRERHYDYMCSISSCNLSRSASEYLSFLPLEVRPKCLSHIVSQEIRIDEKCAHGAACDFIRTFRQRIKAKKFYDALWSIARVPECERIQFKEELDRLKILDFECCDEMRTYLTENGRIIDDTEKDECVFLTNTLSVCKLLVKHADQYPGTHEQVSKVASSLKAVICFSKEFFVDSGLLVRLIRCQNDDEIENMLIEEGLSTKQDDMSAPKPGSSVPDQEQSLFSYNPDVRFTPKEYVGYLKPSASGGEPQLVFARIVREAVERTKNADDGPDMFREYDIDVGLGYPITVQSLDLCREVKRHSIDENKKVLPAHDTGPVLHSSSGSAATEEAKHVVTRLIEEVYADPNREHEREKLKKRLFLKWHPDKHENAEMAKDVFQHLTVEFERLERKYLASKEEEEEETEECVYEWEGEVEAIELQEKSPEEIAEEEEAKKAALTREQEERRKKAERWVRQCMKDMACAQILQENGGFEWAVRACHEVVRKVLIAAIVCHQRLSSELERCKQLSLLAGAIKQLKSLPVELEGDITELNNLKVDPLLASDPAKQGDNHVIPADVYTEEMTDRAVEVTERVVDYMLTFLGFQDVG